MLGLELPTLVSAVTVKVLLADCNHVEKEYTIVDGF